MKFYSIILICFLLASFKASAQNDSLKIDSLKKVLMREKEDTNKVNTLNELCFTLRYNDSKNAIQFGKEAIALAEHLHFSKGAGTAYHNISYAYENQNDYQNAQKNFLMALEMLQNVKDTSNLALIYNELASLYASVLMNYSQSLNYAYKALKLYELKVDKKAIAKTLALIGNVNIFQGNLTDALEMLTKAQELYRQTGNKQGVADCSNGIGDIFLEQNDYTGAIRKYTDALKTYKEFDDLYWIGWSYQSIGRAYEGEGSQVLTLNKKEADSLLNLGLKNYKDAQKIFVEIQDETGITASNIHIGSTNVKLKNFDEAAKSLSKGIEQAKKNNNKRDFRDGLAALAKMDSALGNYKQAYDHYKMYILIRDSLVNEEETKKSQEIKNQYEFDKQNAIAKEQQDKKDAEASRIKNQQYFIIASLAAIVLFVITIAFIQYRNNKHKQKANKVLETTLTNLKSTQSQLIQSEKMASLGQLTAGIAHEIQNPLNFVNNFSDVNKELLTEMKDEMDKGNLDDAKAIANDVIDNEEKINHHGKRAGDIVKGMLQHSRTTSGVKEPTDINTLCDEYLRLSYNGLRAKDKDFNATMQTNFDESIGKINIVPQDIGRVILNLINNAFYAVNEKKKTANENYEPTVSIQTKKINNKVEITVSDNGNGIQQKIVDKIFQPFFTTKPTGSGTGLGLSLSYDIIKAHSGEIKVESKEGEGSKFIIQLLTT